MRRGMSVTVSRQVEVPATVLEAPAMEPVTVSRHVGGAPVRGGGLVGGVR